MTKNNSNPLMKQWIELGREISSTQQACVEVPMQNKLLNFFQIGEFYYFYFNPTTITFEQTSSSFKTIIGYEPHELTIELLFTLIHPDDVMKFMDFEQTVVKFLQELPVDKLGKYKVQYNFRIRKKCGQYIHILHQAINLEADVNGNIIRNLILHTDISSIKENNKMTLSFIGLDGEPSFYHVHTTNVFSKSNNPLTKREKQIILLFAKYYSTDQIAESLFISPLTVNTHRKNILKKTSCKNMMESLQYCIDKGWV